MSDKPAKFVYWTPRVLTILFLCFLAMFSLDVITLEASIGEMIIGLFMHNIPVFVLAIILVVSWKREIVGGVAFILAGLLYIAMLAMNAVRGQFEWYMISWALTIAGPAFLIGILFIINWRQRKARRGKPAAAGTMNI